MNAGASPASADTCASMSAAPAIAATASATARVVNPFLDISHLVVPRCMRTVALRYDESMTGISVSLSRDASIGWEEEAMNTWVARIFMMPAVLWLNANGAGCFRLRGTGSQRRPVPPRVRGNTRESRGWTDGRGIQGGAYTNAAFFLRAPYLRARNAWGFYC